MTRALAVAAAVAVVTVGLLQASPEAHERVHADSHHADHVCAVTLAEAGFCDTSASAPAVSTFSAHEAAESPAASVHHWTAPHYWHQPAQAPPAQARATS